MKADFEKMQKLQEQVKNIHVSLKSMKSKIESDLLSHSELHKSNEPMDPTFKQNHQELISKLYSEFKNHKDVAVSKADKVKFMKEVLGLQLG
jgi:uncharacterized protein YaaN involved in tellurite resistance